MSLKEKTELLSRAKKEIVAMGGKDAVASQHARGKMTARERVELLCDPGTFDEQGALAHHTSTHPDLKDRATPADGVVTGFGRVDGRPVAVIAYDFTVLAGSMGKHGETKVARMREQALQREIPILWLLDSAGARIQELAGSQFAGEGKLFRDQVVMSGVVPQVAAVMGPTAAGTSYIAALADFVPMVKGIGTMALAGPALVKTAIGEEIDIDALGGSKVHTTLSGVGTLECEDDKTCLEASRKFLSYLPSGFRAPLPVRKADAPARGDDSIFDLIPPSTRRAYDMRLLLQWLADPGSLLELQPEWAKNLIVAFARIGGIPVGVVANQPMVLGGALDLDGADKAARFMSLCDAFGVPLIFVHDCPGFMVGSKMEHAGIIRHGAKMLYAVSRLTTPKLSLVVRKSYGAGYFVMCGRGYDPHSIVAWPGAEISLMSPEGAAAIVGTTDKEAVESYRSKIGVEQSAKEAWIDDVIDPRETRRWAWGHLRVLVPKHEEERRLLGAKKHGVSPV